MIIIIDALYIWIVIPQAVESAEHNQHYTYNSSHIEKATQAYENKPNKFSSKCFEKERKEIESRSALEFE